MSKEYDAHVQICITLSKLGALKNFCEYFGSIEDQNILTTWKIKSFQEEIWSIDFDRWLVSECRVLEKKQVVTHSLMDSSSCINS